jgi:uncharacterized membrane protein
MAIEMMAWLLAIPLLGVTTGLRSMTPMAVICWFAHLGYLPVEGTWASWTAGTAAVAIFTVLAVGELIADKLPRTPNRTAVGPLVWRLILGGLAGAIAATSLQGPGIEGVLLSVVGALAGAFAGFMVRRKLVEQIDCADWKIAVVEDLIAIFGAVFALHVITG